MTSLKTAAVVVVALACNDTNALNVSMAAAEAANDAAAAATLQRELNANF